MGKSAGELMQTMRQYMRHASYSGTNSRRIFHVWKALHVSGIQILLYSWHPILEPDNGPMHSPGTVEGSAG